MNKPLGQANEPDLLCILQFHPAGALQPFQLHVLSRVPSHFRQFSEMTRVPRPENSHLPNQSQSPHCAGPEPNAEESAFQQAFWFPS